MSAQHHYVSKFHLRQFLDPESLSRKDPWLWHGDIPDGPVKRRSPKRVGTGRLAFDGSGAFADRTTTLESFLSQEVESPAASAMREFCARPSGSGGSLPHALMRYLGWAAARSAPMRTLEAQWAEEADLETQNFVEAPPEWLTSAATVARDMQLKHPSLGTRVAPAGCDIDQLMKEGWRPDPTDRTNFLEMVHIQAAYFQTRFFPRFLWHTLHAPEGQFFVIGDRAVGWVADGEIDAPPRALRHPTAFVLAPLSRNLVLVGRHTTEPWRVTPAQVNQVVAAWSHEWIAGPTADVVHQALAARREALGEGGERGSLI